MSGYNGRVTVSGQSQKRAVQNYRQRLAERGLDRFEVLGRAQDKELIRSLAKRLADDGAEAARLRGDLARAVSDEPTAKGGVLAALRRSPLVGADFDVSREETTGRAVDL
jgi:hypothetical protein